MLVLPFPAPEQRAEKLQTLGFILFCEYVAISLAVTIRLELRCVLLALVAPSTC